MNCVEFLKAVWPSTGLYCVVRGPFPRQNGSGTYFKHDGFETIQAAAAFATSKCQTESTYFAVHSLKGRVPYAREDGTSYDRVLRTTTNMAWAKCFYTDIDCGPKKPYANKREGLAALIEFCKATGLPMPMIVSSGNGLHCYWILTNELTSDEWKIHADKLKALTIHFGFQTDPAITADTTRILRPVGTFNLKDPANPIKVHVRWAQPEPIETAVFLAILETAYAKLPEPEVAKSLELKPADRPRPSDVAKVCPTFRKMVADAPTARGVVWMNTNLLSLHTKGGSDMAHALARKHPDYSADETQAKLQRMLDNNIGPPTCGKLEEMYGVESPCPTCEFYGRPKSSPVVFARQLPTTALPTEIPPPQLPYMRTKRGIEFVPPVTADEDKQKPAQVICPYDLYPRQIVDEAMQETKRIEWVAVVPHKGELSFALGADIYGNEDRLISALANRGVVLDKRNAKQMGGYMSHYIRLLQQHRQEQVQHENFGWTRGHKEFVLDEVITAGDPRPAVLAPNLSNVASNMKRKGALEGQLAALRFYNDPAYVRQQFMIASSLGATLLHMTGHLGVIINISGPSGASKSTCLYAGLSLWGRGDKLAMGGGEDEATALGRSGRIRMFANVPVGVDEITLMPAEQVKRMAMSITQNGDRIRRKRDGTEVAIPDTEKSTSMLTTSNNSAHALMSFNNQAGNAGSMRLLEILSPRLYRHTKTEADEAMREFRKHYGHVGPIFIQYVIRNYDAIQARVTKVLAEIDARARISQEERFWAAAIAVAYVALQIANKLGLLDYDAEAVLTWALQDLIPASRRIVRDSYVEPIDVLQNYIDAIANHMLVVTQYSEGLGTNKMVWAATRKPISALKARLEAGPGVTPALYLATAPFKEYCDYRKIVYDTTVQTLIHNKVLVREKLKLTRFIAEFESGLQWALKVDLNHEMMAGAAPIEIDNKVVHLFPGKKSPLTLG